MCKVISKKENQSIEKVSLSLDELKEVPVVAVDHDFFISSMGSELVNCIKVFARTPPESKALIVKKLKEKFIK
jgi:magnesium-transporting ATPase (P-type)